jgi:glycosyltransferase involved in cell wall biosynthesis
MDVGVLCSVAVETLSLAALEMMAAGLPLVLSDLGGASEIVADGVNGSLYPVGDTMALVERLSAICLDPVRRSRMGLSSLARVREKFALDRMVAEYAALFSQLIEM